MQWQHTLILFLLINVVEIFVFIRIAVICHPTIQNVNITYCTINSASMRVIPRMADGELVKSQHIQNTVKEMEI